MKVCFDSESMCFLSEFSDEAAYGDEECNSWIFQEFSQNYRLSIQDVKDCYILYPFVAILLLLQANTLYSYGLEGLQFCFLLQSAFLSTPKNQLE